MKLKWTQKKLTLVVIPDVNRSVVRLHIPNFLAYGAAAVLATLILVSLTMSYLHIHSLSTTYALKSRLAAADQEWHQTITNKDQSILQLQNEVIQLSQQADQMKTKVSEMKKLESDLKNIANINPLPQGTKKIETPADSSSLPIQGEGGSMIPVTQEEILKLGNQTESEMTALSREIEELRTNFTTTKKIVEEKQNLQRSTPTIWPTTSQVVTSSYGYRRDPLTHTPSFHDGIDIGASENEPVFAAADGKVITSGFDNARGNNIVIQHANGLRSWYMHLNKIIIIEGDSVTKGQTIGLVGSTGRSTGPHLHYELVKDGETIDPKPFLQTTRKDDNP